MKSPKHITIPVIIELVHNIVGEDQYLTKSEIADTKCYEYSVVHMNNYA